MSTSLNAPSATQTEGERLPLPQQNLVTTENLPKIRALVRVSAVNRASLYLATWGIINLLGWWYAFEENAKILRSVQDMGTWTYLFLYFGLAIGCAMLLFAAVGALTRSAATISLSGISLIAVGIWNLCSGVFIEAWLAPAGNTINGPDDLYGFLGICQVVWGVFRIRTGTRIGLWSCSTLSRPELTELRTKLRSFVGKCEGTRPGIVRSTIFGSGFLGFFKRKTAYHGQLAEQSAIFVSDTLNDCFEISLKAIPKADLDENRLKVAADDGTRVLFIWPQSISAFREWGLRAFTGSQEGVRSESTSAGTSLNEASIQPPLGVAPEIRNSQAMVGVSLLAVGTLALLVSFFVGSSVSPYFAMFGIPSAVCGVWILMRAGRNRRRQWESPGKLR